MKQPIDIVPDYIRQRYPSHQALMEAITRGEVMRDGYGNIVLRDQPPMTNTQCFPPNYGYYPAMQSIYQCPVYQNACGYCPVYCAQPVEQNKPEIVDFSFFNIEGIRGYYKLDDNGNRIKLVNAEDIARGAGMVDKERQRVTATSGGNEIIHHQPESIRWKRINEYAQSRLPYLQQAGMNPSLLQFIPEKIDRDSYIPIELAVQIISCADSEQAKLFQAIVSLTVAREIDRMIDAKYSEKMNSLQGQINNMNRQLEEKERLMTEARDYYREFNDTEHCSSTTEIAKDYGMSAQTLNQVLYSLGIIYPVNGTWQLYQHFASFGYTTTKNENGTIGVYWTPDGKYFVEMNLRRAGFKKNEDNKAVIERLVYREK